MPDDRQRAYRDGKHAFRDGVSPFANPHAPAPPGNIMHARLWRAGWQAAKRRHSAQLINRQADDIDDTVQTVYSTNMSTPPQTATAFNTWLDTFISEKGLDTEHVFTVETDGFWKCHIIPLVAVIEHAKLASTATQGQIKAILVKIDFLNGDPMHFFEHLAKGLAASYESDWNND